MGPAFQVFAPTSLLKGCGHDDAPLTTQLPHTVELACSNSRGNTPACVRGLVAPAPLRPPEDGPDLERGHSGLGGELVASNGSLLTDSKGIPPLHVCAGSVRPRSWGLKGRHPRRR